MYSVIPDDGKHDVALVYEVQKAISGDNCKLPGLSTIIYFTNGCTEQYRNWKKFYNLCQHKSDFGLNVRWVFFATSHGKQPCDRIGGTVKQLVSNANLKCDLKDQILSPSDMFHSPVSILQGKYSEYYLQIYF